MDEHNYNFMKINPETIKTEAELRAYLDQQMPGYRQTIAPYADWVTHFMQLSREELEQKDIKFLASKNKFLLGWSSGKQDWEIYPATSQFQEDVLAVIKLFPIPGPWLVRFEGNSAEWASFREFTIYWSGTPLDRPTVMQQFMEAHTTPLMRPTSVKLSLPDIDFD